MVGSVKEKNLKNLKWWIVTFFNRITFQKIVEKEIEKVINEPLIDWNDFKDDEERGKVGLYLMLGRIANKYKPDLPDKLNKKYSYLFEYDL